MRISKPKLTSYIWVITIIAAMLVSGAGSEVAAQQSCTDPSCTNPACNINPVNCAPNCKAGTADLLNILWRGIPLDNTSDRRSTFLPSERDSFTTQGATFDGAIFYEPNCSMNGTETAYRMFNNTTPADRRDALTTTEIAHGFTYTLDNALPSGVLGFPWLNNPTGTVQFRQVFNTAISDSATVNPNEPSLPGYNDDGYLGQSTGQGPVYGYRRYNNTADQDLIVRFSATPDVGVTLGSNKNAGGALWE